MKKIALIIYLMYILSNTVIYAQSIVVDPGEADPEAFGYDISYQVSGLDPTMSYSFVWSTRENDDFVQNWQTADTTSNSFSRKLNIPGEFDIRCVYTPNRTISNPNPQPATVIRHVTVSPPTASKPSGLNLDTQYNPQNNTPSSTDLNNAYGRYLIFPLSDFGPYGSVWAQEKITNAKVNKTDPPGTIDWAPPDNNDVRFQIKQDPNTKKRYIYDFKTTTVPNGGTPPVAPSQLGTYTQSLRICWRNTNGDLKSSSCLPDQDYTISATNNSPPRWQTSSP